MAAELAKLLEEQRQWCVDVEETLNGLALALKVERPTISELRDALTGSLYLNRNAIAIIQSMCNGIERNFP